MCPPLLCASKECLSFQSRQGRKAVSCQGRDSGGGRSNRAQKLHHIATSTHTVEEERGEHQDLGPQRGKCSSHPQSWESFRVGIGKGGDGSHRGLSLSQVSRECSSCHMRRRWPTRAQLAVQSRVDKGSPWRGRRVSALPRTHPVASLPSTIHTHTLQHTDTLEPGLRWPQAGGSLRRRAGRA